MLLHRTQSQDGGSYFAEHKLKKLGLLRRTQPKGGEVFFAAHKLNTACFFRLISGQDEFKTQVCCAFFAYFKNKKVKFTSLKFFLSRIHIGDAVRNLQYPRIRPRLLNRRIQLYFVAIKIEMVSFASPSQD